MSVLVMACDGPHRPEVQGQGPWYVQRLGAYFSFGAGSALMQVMVIGRPGTEVASDVLIGILDKLTESRGNR